MDDTHADDTLLDMRNCTLSFCLKIELFNKEAEPFHF